MNHDESKEYIKKSLLEVRKKESVKDFNSFQKALSEKGIRVSDSEKVYFNTTSGDFKYSLFEGEKLVYSIHGKNLLHKGKKSFSKHAITKQLAEKNKRSL